MTKYITQERAKYFPVPHELMAQYKDGSHSINEIVGTTWFQNGQTHRDDDKPAYIGTDGSLAWYQNDQLHRGKDKPAWITDYGDLVWYQNDQRHRTRGPALITAGGRLEWAVNGRDITLEVEEWLAGDEWQGTPLQIFEFQLRFT